MDNSDSIEPPFSTSSSASSAVWRKEVDRYKSMYERERDQFEEFQRYSKELETELDLELKQRDRKIVDLEAANRRLRDELEGIKTKFEKDRREHHALEQELRSKASRAEEACGELRQKLRAVEQANDDFERRERIHQQQLLDISERYDQCLERCALLEAGLAVAAPRGGNNNDSAGGGDSMMEVGGAGAAGVGGAEMDGEDGMQLQQSPSNNIHQLAQQAANGRPSQRLIAQMLRKMEAAEAHMNSSSSTSTTSPAGSPPFSSAMMLPSSSSATNGHHTSFDAHPHNNGPAAANNSNNTSNSGSASPFRFFRRTVHNQQHSKNDPSSSSLNTTR